MADKYTCCYCGDDFSSSQIDWEVSDGEEYYCKSCSESLQQAGIDAMDPDGHGYDEYGVWDGERLGF